VVFGVGGIGTQIAVRANAFGMRVIGVDVRDMPYVPFLEKSVRPDRLDTVLPEADVVFVSAPHTPETEKTFKARQFALMKDNSFFIAVSRGKLYDAEALAQALANKHLAGAGVDVTDPEPLPKGHALWKFDNVIITPHIAGRSDREHRRYIELYKENLQRFANGEPLLHVVDKQKGF
jgi:phosphoglycerate dehydrogenase-like enzyme